MTSNLSIKKFRIADNLTIIDQIKYDQNFFEFILTF